MVEHILVDWYRGKSLHAGRGSSFVSGHSKFFLGQYSLGRRGRSPLCGTKVGALRRKDKPLEAIWIEAW